MTKAERHALILDLIKSQSISTQEELQKHLALHGCQVTQATVSRDMKELKLVKSTGRDGSYRYNAPQVLHPDELTLKYRRIFQEAVAKLTISGNFVIVKCYTGMGNAACEAMDALEFPEVVGSIAGDNTIFVAVSFPEDAARLVEKLDEILEGSYAH